MPVLETVRLRLRGHRPADYVAFVAMWQEPAFYRFLSPGPLPAEDVWNKLLRNVGHWTLLGYGFWAVEEKATGRFIGNVGFGNFQRALEPPIGEAPEMGWVLAPDTHGRGYASEAVAAALSWARVRFGPERMVCLIHPENSGSRRVAAKFGFREYARTTYKGQPGLLLERTGARSEQPA